MEDLRAPSSYFDKEDFETMADSVRTKIQNYFSKLIDTIRMRQTELISELDEIISRYRLQRIRIRDKIKELEKLRRYHEDLYSSSTVRELQTDILSNIKSELAEIEVERKKPFSVDFGWNPKNEMRASKFGEIKVISKNKSICIADPVSHKKDKSKKLQLKSTLCNKFIFSKRLYEGLIYKTDVGPIPRDSYCEEHLRSTFTEYSNWRVAIEGCYWCGKANNPSPYMYVCDKKCYQFLHEWCRRKLFEFCGDSMCMYPGCEMLSLGDASVCSDIHLVRLESDYKTIYSKSIDKAKTNTPYYYSVDNTVKCSDSNTIPNFNLRDILSSSKLEQSTNSYQIRDIISDCSSNEESQSQEPLIHCTVLPFYSAKTSRHSPSDITHPSYKIPKLS